MIPSYFIAHGAPLLALENNEYTTFLGELGKDIAKPKAIILFSAHWQSSTQKVGDVAQYETIYDFYGFPDALYRIEYPANGDKQTVDDIKNLFQQAKIPFAIDTERGLDHGAWVVLRLLYPNADIPVISMSVNAKLSPEEQYKIGQSLQYLREKDVLIIASGGTVHNLRAVNMGPNDNKVDEWAKQFEEWLEKQVTDWNLSVLFQYETLAPNASLAVPPYGSEHFIPLFYAMGAADKTRQANLLHRSFRYGNLSHTVWQFK